MAVAPSILSGKPEKVRTPFNQKQCLLPGRRLCPVRASCPWGRTLFPQTCARYIWERVRMMGRGFQPRKSDGRCQEGAVKHLQPLAQQQHPIPCVSAARCALHIIRVHLLSSVFRGTSEIRDVWSQNAFENTCFQLPELRISLHY